MIVDSDNIKDILAKDVEFIDNFEEKIEKFKENDMDAVQKEKIKEYKKIMEQLPPLEFSTNEAVLKTVSDLIEQTEQGVSKVKEMEQNREFLNKESLKAFIANYGVKGDGTNFPVEVVDTEEFRNRPNYKQISDRQAKIIKSKHNYR